MHEISIPDSVAAAVRGRHGGRGRYERIAGPRTALVVVDMQNYFLLPGMPVEVPAAREIIPTINRLTAAVREVGGTVVWVQMTLEGQRESWSVFFEDPPPGDAVADLTPGTHPHALHADLDVRPEDLLVRKSRFSAFVQGSSNIDQILRQRGIDTVVVTGTLTNVCCESSTRDAMMLNYRVIMVADANAALSDAEHNATLVSVLQFFGDVRTTDEVIERLTREVIEPTGAVAS